MNLVLILLQKSRQHMVRAAVPYSSTTRTPLYHPFIRNADSTWFRQQASSTLQALHMRPSYAVPTKENEHKLRTRWKDAQLVLKRVFFN